MRRRCFSMASYYEKKGQDSLYQVQLDTILLNDNVDSDTKDEHYAPAYSAF